MKWKAKFSKNVEGAIAKHEKVGTEEDDVAVKAKTTTSTLMADEVEGTSTENGEDVVAKWAKVRMENDVVVKACGKWRESKD